MPVLAAPPPPIVTCAIERKTVDQGLLFQGVLRAASPVEGSYLLTVIKTSASGSANLKQKGTFSASAGQIVPLGRIGLNQETEVSIDVRLTLDIAGQEIVCSQYTGGNE
ncbi:hypothetical protein GCM10007036_22110 [Alsobacter metallidurans]|uniref:CsgH-like domain-containing protein n=1 Tax=Alsobacter metallidurans TaxID=340221 RepID=A0A917MHW2_9HYPH|nr:curli-like amyloid fiber formation chaperone CsgH [Alsobacter metallidurans]GGH19307.1 hypothetical protein GCM10007036_22110 [Alsobacter metallidurans]